MNGLGPDGIRALAAKLDVVPELTSLYLGGTRSLFDLWIRGEGGAEGSCGWGASAVPDCVQ